MKNLVPLLSIVLLQLIINNLYSQELWGVTPEGGANENGTLFKIDIPSGIHEIEYDFPYADGISPKYLIESNDGYIYGTTSGFGTGLDGNIIRLNPNNYSYESIFQFTDSLGRYPGSIFQDSLSGYIYGINTYGGQYDKGNIFKFNPYTNVYYILFSFDYTLGAEPMGNLIPLNESLFYGVTKSGGNTIRGVLYSFNINSNEYSVLFNFSDSLGSSRKNIMLASDSCIYGTTYFGGMNEEGVIFRFDLSTGVYSKLFDFSIPTGASMKSSLIEASNGKLYGTANLGGEHGGGVLFEFDMQTETYSIKHNFEYYKGLPIWYLSELEEGELFGCTNMGGYYHCGTTFKFDLMNDSLTYINDFNLNMGSRPSGLFFKCSNGKIISTTYGGGSFNFGTLFEFDISEYSMSKIYDFYGFTEFHNVIGAPLNSPEGEIYGLTHFKEGSSLDSDGTFFSVNKETKEYNVLDVFSRPSNSLSNYNYKYYFYPRRGLSELYFRGYFPDSSKAYSLFEFINPLGSPTGEMVLADDKLFYGMQSTSSPNPAGMIFSINPLNYENENNAWFWGPNGAYPSYNSLVNIEDGYLYGLTSKGGDNNSGVIFKYNSEIDEIVKLYDFSYLTGAEPNGKLLHLENGVFYGTTHFGGENDKGVLFKYSLSENEYEVIRNFSTENGANPTGNLLKASNGKVYGMTTNGGEYDKGVVFEFDIETNSYGKILDFNGGNGSHPFENSLIEACNLPTIVSQPVNKDVIYGDSTSLIFITSDGDIIGFQWYRHNMPLEGATDDTLVIYDASIFDQGYYFCKVITPCGSIFSNTVKVSLVNGINSIDLPCSIKVFPNPAKNELNLNFEHQQPVIDLKIIDLFGYHLIEKHFENVKDVKLDISFLSNGVYFINITITGKESFIKIIKN